MIRAERLTKRFGSAVAVDQLDLEIPAGEVFCFLGPNGAGKTTTIKMFTGLQRPSEGRAHIGGHDIQRQPLEAKRLLGYIPDHPFLYEKLTGREWMRFVGGLYRMDDSEIASQTTKLLEHYGIAAAADRLVEHYSHGMRQKLSFASCFLHDPKIVVIDEPWVGLDPKSLREIKDDLRVRARAGLTVFMSTHTLSIAEEMADRVGIIHRGRLLNVGTVAEVKALAARPGSLEDVFLELTREDDGAT